MSSQHQFYLEWANGYFLSPVPKKLSVLKIAVAEVLHDVKDLIYIHPDASLYDAIKMLIHNKIHR